ncbi:nitrite reductase small subunit NirD [Micromonospora sp. CPCC 206060]|uniref:nitrite reductase small subunit NirD n=1 Tax=Micromonospora sp. CPCC 206060 TaxID=3122406 RepID=UPI002FF2C65D
MNTDVLPPVLTPVLTAWTAVCHYDRLEPDRGVAALLGGEQVALFRCGDELYAVENRDPVTGAYVMSRGLIGSRGDVPTLAAPLHKQVYDLRTGRCLDLPGVSLVTYPVRERDGLVEVLLDPSAVFAGERAP